jgi:flagellar basal body-associated protein FliL
MLNESETAPIGSTMTPKQVRMIKISIVIMTVLLIAGFILLIVGLFMRAGNKAQTTQAGPRPPLAVSEAMPAILSLPVEAGAELVNVLTEQGRLILHLRQPGGSEVAIIDLATGQEIQRIKLAPRN